MTGPFDAGVASLSSRRAFLGAAVVAGAASASLAQACTTTATSSKTVYNVQEYGVIPGLSAADQTANINCVVDMVGNLGGGVVFFPTGSYRVDGTVHVHSSGVTLAGVRATGSDPWGSKLVVNNNFNGPTIALGYTGASPPIGNGTAGVAVRELAIQSPSQRTAGTALLVRGAVDVLVEDVSMYRQNVGLSIEEEPGSSSASVFINRLRVDEVSQGGVGIRITDSLYTGEIHVSRCVMTGRALTEGAPASDYSYVGCLIGSAGGIYMDSCDFVRFRYGLLIAPATGTFNWGFFSNCSWDSSGTRCMQIEPTESGLVHGLTFTNCWAASSKYNDGCYVGGPVGAVNGVSFVAHRFLNNIGANGLYVGSGPKNVTADSCIASGHPNGAGFVLDNNSGNFAIRNCQSGVYGGPGATSFPGNGWGVAIVPGSNNYVVSGNIFNGNTNGSIWEPTPGSNRLVPGNLVS